MDSSVKKDFTRRLSQCNPGEMIVIIYDILFAYLDDTKKAYAAGDREEMKTGIRKAQKVLDELIQSLDFSYELSNNLYALYVFCKNELARTMYENRLDGLLEAKKSWGACMAPSSKSPDRTPAVRSCKIPSRFMRE